MIIPDTSIWIEFFRQNMEYAPKVRELLENREIYTLECIFAELLQGAKNKREIQLISDYWNYLPRLSIQGLWIDAGRYSSENKLFSKGIGIIDCVIVMAAKRNYVQVWTLDKKLNNILDENERFIFPEAIN